jgi:hypothetical protein
LHFFFFKLTIPGGRAGKERQCPAPEQKKDDKCPAPGHTDSFIECILIRPQNFHNSISFLVLLLASFLSVALYAITVQSITNQRASSGIGFMFLSLHVIVPDIKRHGEG